MPAFSRSSNKYFEMRGGADPRIGGTYTKAKFVGYTDTTFSSYLERPEDQHLGILGPVLRAEAGDTLKVTLKNNLTFPVSLLPHALEYGASEEVGESNL